MAAKKSKRTTHKKPKSKHIYALNQNRIQMDDIILISAKGIVSAGIRAGTSSDFSHVAICTRPNMLLEATRKGGVKRSSVLGTYATKEKWIKVLRPKNPLPPDKFGYGVSDYAERLYGRRYTIVGAITSRLGILPIQDEGKEFCSRIVAQAYSDYGISLVPGVEPSKIFPALLENSRALDDVSTTCVRELDSIKDAPLYNQCISISKAILVDTDMKMNFRALKDIRTRLGKKIPKTLHSLTDIWKWLIEGSAAAQTADPVIYEILQLQGFASYYDGVHADRQLTALLWEQFAGYAESLPASPGPDANMLVEEFATGIPLSETSLKSREITKLEYDGHIKTSSLKTIQYLYQIFERDYRLAQQTHSAYVRFVSALKKAAGNV